MKNVIHKLFHWADNHPIITTLITGILVSVIVEMFNQRSIVGGFLFPFHNPLLFVMNAGIITSVLFISLFFKKSRIILSLLSMVWLLLAIINFAVRTYRTTPLRALDFRVASSVINIVNMYFTKAQLTLLIAAIAAVLALLVFAWIKCKKTRPKYGRSVLGFFAAVLLTFLSIELAINSNSVPTHFDNLTNAYKDYGFVYCFTASLIGNGISKPDTYSQSNIDRIKIDNTSLEESSDDRPNIIYVQLESFFDVSMLKNLTYSEDPTPNFNALKEKNPSGKLTVSSFGTGTANTEFDILTGYSVQFFGAGEYPYSTILRETTCDSINYNLKELGYSTHAIHDHAGNFYARNKVYPNLGFDTFTSVEYMEAVEYNVLGWAKDKILTQQILNTLDSTENQDFIFAVSVQPHGRYSQEVIDFTQTITVDGLPDEGTKNAYEYYINQLHQTDAFVGELISALKEIDEDTIVVFYGDHLPNIGMEQEDLTEGSTIYDSEYVIWSNFKTNIEDKDLTTYQLSAYFFNILGFKNWPLANLHQNYFYDTTNTNYLNDLKMLQYDTLYGEEYYYNDEEKPQPTEMRMGIYDIKITDVLQIGEDLHVIGENFTESSVVAVEGDRLETVFISPNDLIVKGVTADFRDRIRVFQMASARSWLSRTEYYYFDLGTASDVVNWDRHDFDAEEHSSGNNIPKQSGESENNIDDNSENS